MKKPILTIENWDTGIADDPYKGFQEVNCLSEVSDSIASTGTKPTISSFIGNAFTAVIDSSTDIITTEDPSIPGVPKNWVGPNAIKTGIAVTFSTTGSLPTGITAGVVYFTIWVSNTTLKIATSLKNADAGTFIDISGTYTGTATMTFLRMNNILHSVVEPVSGAVYALDTAGRVWANVDGQDVLSYNWFYLLDRDSAGTAPTLTSAAGNGLAIWRNYLFVFRNTAIDLYGPLDPSGGTQAWTNSWSSGVISSGLHTAFTSQDDKLYFCNGRYVGSLVENAGKTFAPSDGTTYTLSVNALDLPPNYTTVDIEDYGRYLAIAATSKNKAFVFPWARTESSFEFPVEVPEASIQSLQNINNILYVITNSRACVYATNLSSVSLIRKIPYNVSRASLNSSDVTLSITCSAKLGGKLFLGIKSGRSSSEGNSGVYSLDVKTGVIKKFGTSSQGYEGNIYYVGAIEFGSGTSVFADGTPYILWFWNNNTSSLPTTFGGVDFVYDKNNKYANYESNIVSPIYQVSTDVFEQTQLSRAIFYFQSSLSSGDAVKLEYRE